MPYIIAAAIYAAAMAPQAKAHDITDVFLTERSANCADYVEALLHK
ncbi:hypothetical protein [Aliishimia ponticola]|nr:hypothetical protein [Aliishimia ponticola]